MAAGIIAAALLAGTAHAAPDRARLGAAEAEDFALSAQARVTVGEEGIEGTPATRTRKSGFSGSASVIDFSGRGRGISAGRAGAVAPSATPLALGPVQLPRFFPLAPRAITSGFGPRQHPILGGQRNHAGVDLAAQYGAPIGATAAGTVRSAGWAGGYGLMVVVDHAGGTQTVYGHMSRLGVAAGQTVRVGDVIGFVGSTGLSTGPHVHYEVRVRGQAVNPAGARR